MPFKTGIWENDNCKASLLYVFSYVLSNVYLEKNLLSTDYREMVSPMYVFNITTSCEKGEKHQTETTRERFLTNVWPFNQLFVEKSYVIFDNNEASCLYVF